MLYSSVTSVRAQPRVYSRRTRRANDEPYLLLVWVRLVARLLLGRTPMVLLGPAIKLLWRGAPPKKAGERCDRGCSLPTDKKNFSWHGMYRVSFIVVCLTADSTRIFAPLTARALRY